MVKVTARTVQVPVITKLPVPLRRAVEQAARRDKTSLSEIVRRALSDYLAES